MKTSPRHHLTSLKFGRQSAFTLVEIMIVLAIIALLTAVAFPSLAKARKNSQLTRLLSHLKTTADAFSLYAAENGKVPYQNAAGGTVVSTAGQVPVGMNTYMPKNSTWTNGNDGTWYWYYNPGALPGYKSYVFLQNSNLTMDDMAYFDKKLDDGNTGTGAIIGLANFGIVVGVE